MADVPIGGLYRWSSTVAQVVDGRLRVGGTPFGPAGVSAVELPDGSTWEVDHADPSQLVAVEVDLDGDEPPPLLIAAFGEGRATELFTEAPSAEVDWDVVDADAFVGSVPPGGMTGPTTMTGRLVRLADLAADPKINPLASIAATAEFLYAADGTPGGDLIAPLIPALIDRADELAAEVSDQSLLLGAKVATRVTGAIELLSGADATPRPGLDELVVRIGESRQRRCDDRSPTNRRSRRPRRADAGSSGSEAGDGPQVEWVTGSLVRVTTPPGGGERWVRALHVRGLVLLAQVPLERGREHDVAELVVPPVLHPDDVLIEVVRRADLQAAAARPIDMIRRAIRAGRMAASDELGGRTRRAEAHWRECADLWHQIGDDRRDRLAIGRITQMRMLAGLPSLPDELGPYD